MAKDNVKRPDKELKLPESGMTLTMTYVIFNDILRFVGGIEEAMTLVMTNQDTRDLIVRRLLTDTKKAIEDIGDLIPPEEVELDIFEIDDVLTWAMEHITYFFMKTATSMQAAVGNYPQMLEMMKTSSNLSETGSPASITTTKSAGPTE